ncbi:MAG: Mpv17/PMP22 family protein [Spirochaetales bacterium]|nr:Mpv17/PMP22 family protein [Spirochaetales bacterium]
MRAHIVPGLVLQAVALSIALAYYFNSFAKNLFENIAVLKTEYGFLFSAISTALFGGLIPFLYLLATKQIPKKSTHKELLFYLLLWAWKGMEVDSFYRLQGIIFGYDPSVAVIVQKTFIDQFVYSPLWAAPSLTIAFLWKDCNFSFATLKEKITKDLFTFKIPSVIFSTWVVWIPAVAIIYCLPMALQVPMFNLVICFWVLILNFISGHNNQAA